MKFAVALLALVVVSCNAASLKKVGNFAYSSCSAAPEAIVISDFIISPDPILIPGTVTFSITVTGTTAVTSPTPGQLTLSYRADASAEWKDLPCVDNFGSCPLDDVCVIMDTLFPGDCPPSFIDQGVPCKCPFEATTYTITDGTLEFVTPLDTLKAGDYKFRVSLSQDGVELQCYEFQVTLAPAP